MKNKFYLKLTFLLVIVLFSSCYTEKAVQFPVAGIEAVLFGQSKAAWEGRLNLAGSKELEYHFGGKFVVPDNSSIQIEYDFSFAPSPEVMQEYSIVANMGISSWQLPMDAEASYAYEYVYKYVIPFDDLFKGSFNITSQRAGTGNKKLDKKSIPDFRIRSISIVERFYGFSDITDESKRTIILTPFINRQGSDYIINVPPSFWKKAFYAGIDVNYLSEGTVLQFAGRRIESVSNAGRIYISPALSLEEGRATLTTANADTFFLIPHEEPLPFPSPITVDPALIINWPRGNWRNSRYEIFRWDRFPSILFIDYADYAVQERMLKRLAFFVEKAGFRGRLSPDSEIGHLHGWNAHNYRAEDLALFFDTARKQKFPLLDEEWQLEKILLNEGIIREVPDASGVSIAAGEGAILSIARETPEYLRYRFLAHEGFHGLYFIDEDFRNFCRQRWERLSSPAKIFITSFFDYQRYDTSYEYLLINEFMGHVMQQTISQASDYFGRHLPQILESSWRAAHLPPKNTASSTWPTLSSAFTAEAQALSAYVNQRWGLSAGRVWTLRVR